MKWSGEHFITLHGVHDAAVGQAIGMLLPPLLQVGLSIFVKLPRWADDEANIWNFYTQDFDEELKSDNYTSDHEEDEE